MLTFSVVHSHDERKPVCLVHGRGRVDNLCPIRRSNEKVSRPKGPKVPPQSLRWTCQCHPSLCSRLSDDGTFFSQCRCSGRWIRRRWQTNPAELFESRIASFVLDSSGLIRKMRSRRTRGSCLCIIQGVDYYVNGAKIIMRNLQPSKIGGPNQRIHIIDRVLEPLSMLSSPGDSSKLVSLTAAKLLKLSKDFDLGGKKIE